MTDEWTALETSRHQDHVIAHVTGATVIGYFIFDSAVHLLLDMRFMWTIFVDGEMGLLSEGLAIDELSLSYEERQRLLAEVDLLREQPAEAPDLELIRPAPIACVISEVNFFGRNDQRRLVLSGEEGSLAIETSLTREEIKVYAF